MGNKSKITYEQIQSTIDKMTYMDDEFFTACLQNRPDAALLILRTVMRKPDLTIVEMPDVQHTVKNLGNKSIRLDLYCRSENKRYDVEVQRKDQGAGFHRARYYVSLIDGTLIVPGDDYDALPDVYVIFITQHDILKAGRPYYTIERTIDELDHKPVNDGTHILYVNGAYIGDDSFGTLMHDFRCVDPNEMYHEELRRPALFFKDTQGGRGQMSTAVEKLVNQSKEEGLEEGRQQGREEGREETKIRTVEKLLQKQTFSDDEIADICDMPVSEVQVIKERLQVTA